MRTSGVFVTNHHAPQAPLPACRAPRALLARPLATTLLIVVLGLSTGCDTMNKMKIDNPVMPDAPPRRAAVDRSASVELVDSPGDIELVTYGNNANQLEDQIGSRVVATVNGSPIFESDVLDRYRAQLNQARPKMSDKEFLELKLALIERDLHIHVENRMLVGAMLATLTPEQQDMLDTQLQNAFDRQVQEMAREMKVATAAEVEAELQKQGSSLAIVQSEFENQALAVEFLRSKANVKDETDRGELIAYYRQHLDDYARAAEVRWEQLVINFRQHGGRAGANQVLQSAIAELQQGQDFAEVARKYSDGPTASQGGDRGWLKEGGLADKEIEQALFTLEPLAISRPFEDKRRFQIVRVLERKAAYHVPFEDVQDKIEETILTEQRQRAFRRVIDEIKAQTTVVTIFDDAQKSPSKNGIIPAG